MILCFLSHPCIIHSNPVAWAWYSDPPTANLAQPKCLDTSVHLRHSIIAL